MATTLKLATEKSDGCGCGCGSAEATPELLAASLPKVIRHGAIIGGLTSMKSGQKVILVADHDPKPLLTQLNRIAPDELDLVYLEQGPDSYRLEFTKR